MVIEPVSAALACKTIIDSGKMVEKEAEDAIGWIGKIKKILGPFKPEIVNFSVNYKTKKSELKLSIYAPTGIIKKSKTIEIPAYQGFQIIEMLDDSFRPIKGAWVQKDNKYVLKTDQLTKGSERFLLQMNGTISESLLNHLVRIQPSTNPNKDPENDKYWLACHLKDTNILEKWWNQLNVSDIEIQVKVAIRRCFTNSIPRDVMVNLEAQREWMAQISRRRIDRETLFKVQRKAHAARASSALNLDEIYRLLVDIASARNLIKFIMVDSPFQLQDVIEDKSPDFYPERMNVDVSTELDFKTPTAKGNLIFKRKEYEDDIKSKIQQEKNKKGKHA